MVSTDSRGSQTLNLNLSLRPGPSRVRLLRVGRSHTGESSENYQHRANWSMRMRTTTVRAYRGTGEA